MYGEFICLLSRLSPAHWQPKLGFGAAKVKVEVEVALHSCPISRCPFACWSPEGSLLTALKRDTGTWGCHSLQQSLHPTWGTVVSPCPHASPPSICLCLWCLLLCFPWCLLARAGSKSLSSLSSLMSAYGSPPLTPTLCLSTFSRPRSWA